MTVAVGTGRSATWTADGTNRAWAFPFKVLSASHVILEVTDTGGFVSEVSGPFSVMGLGESDGGSVVYPIAPAAALPAGYKVRVVRRVPFDQPNRIGNQGGFHARTHEDTFDLLAQQVQQIYEDGTARGITAPFDDGDLDMTLPGKAARADKVLGFGSDGRPSAEFSVAALLAALAAAQAALAGAGAAGVVWPSRAAAAAANIPAPIQYLRTAGYATAGDGGGALYARMQTAPSSPKAWHFQSGDGAWWLLSERTVALEMFGAVPGSTAAAGANVTALGNALDWCIETGSGAVEVSAGTWYLNGAIVKDYTSKPRTSITLRGKGLRSSVLRWTVAGGGIDLTMMGTVQVEDLGLMTDAASTKAALRVDFRDALPTILAKRLFISGSGIFGGPASSHWKKGLAINNPGGNSHITECVIWGLGSNKDAMESGIEYLSDIQGTQVRCERNLVTLANIGIVVKGPGGIEGLHIKTNDFVTVTNGVYLDFATSSYRHPHFDIDGNHIQSFGGYSIFMRKAAQAFVRNNLLYGDTGTLQGILLSDCEDVIIAQNHVQMSANQIAIGLDGATYNCTVLSNNLHTTGVGISLAASAYDNKVHDQLYHSGVTTKIQNLGTNNLTELSSAANPGYRQNFDMMEQWGNQSVTLNANGAGIITLPLGFADKNYSASINIGEATQLPGYDCRPSYTDSTATTLVFAVKRSSDGTVASAANATVRVQWKATGKAK